MRPTRTETRLRPCGQPSCEGEALTPTNAHNLVFASSILLHFACCTNFCIIDCLKSILQLTLLARWNQSTSQQSADTSPNNWNQLDWTCWDIRISTRLRKSVRPTDVPRHTCSNVCKHVGLNKGPRLGQTATTLDPMCQ